MGLGLRLEMLLELRLRLGKRPGRLELVVELGDGLRLGLGLELGLGPA